MLCKASNSAFPQQGPIAQVCISEVSLGHSRSAKKVARAALSWQFRLPFTVRNLSIELRSSSAVNSTDTFVETKKAKGQPRSKLLVKCSKILLNSSLRLLLGVLPNIPVRLKQLTVKHQVSGEHSTFA